MDPVTVTQISTAFRQLLLFAGGFAVAKGWVSDDQLQIIVPAVITLAVAGYGIWKRRPDGLIKSAARVEKVKQIITDEDTASKIPSAKVVPPSVTVPVPPQV